MGKDQFARLVRFAQRTGDRLIVTDPEGREPIVIMSLDEYETLLNGALGPGKAFSVPGIVENEHFVHDEQEEDIFVPEFAPPLEVVEESTGEGVDTKSIQTVARAEQRMAPRPQSSVPGTPRPPSWAKSARQEPGEEQFYLEPI